MRQRAQSKLQQGQLLVVAGDAVGADRAAAGATVDQGPLAVISDINADRLHGCTTGAGSIARRVIDVAGSQAVRAMVAMACAERSGPRFHTVADTAKAV